MIDGTCPDCYGYLLCARAKQQCGFPLGVGSGNMLGEYMVGVR